MIHMSDEARQRMQDYLGAEGPWGIRVVASPG